MLWDSRGSRGPLRAKRCSAVIDDDVLEGDIDSLPPKARRIWDRMHSSTLREWKGSPEEKAAVARAAAWAAVRSKFVKTDGEWTEREELTVESSLEPERGRFTREVGFKFVEAATDATHRVTFSEVYVPWEVDAHGDFADEKTIERAAWGFMRHLDKIGDQHRAWGGKGFPVENFVSREGDPDFPVPGSWVMGIQWSPDQWQKILRGERTGLSLGGDWIRIPVVMGQELLGAKSAKGDPEIRPKARALYQMVGLNVEEVSSVDSPATRKTFRLFKADDESQGASMADPKKMTGPVALSFADGVKAVDDLIGAGAGHPVCSILQLKFPGEGGKGILLPEGVTLEKAASECATAAKSFGIEIPELPREQVALVKAIERVFEPVRMALVKIGLVPGTKQDGVDDCVAAKMGDEAFRAEFETEEQALAVALEKCRADAGTLAAGAAKEDEPMTTEERAELDALKQDVGAMKGALEEIKALLGGGGKSGKDAGATTTTTTTTAPAAAAAQPDPDGEKNGDEDEELFEPGPAETGAALIELAKAVEEVATAVLELKSRPGTSHQVIGVPIVNGGGRKSDQGEDAYEFSTITGVPILKSERMRLAKEHDDRMEKRYGDKRGTKKNGSGLGMRMVKRV